MDLGKCNVRSPVAPDPTPEQRLCPASEGHTAPHEGTSRRLRPGPSPALEPSETLSRDRDPREAGQTVGQRRFLELDLRKAPRQEVVVGLHVEVPVSAEVE